MTLEDLKSAAKVVGIKQTIKAAERNGLTCIFLAADADRKVVEPIRTISTQKAIPLIVEGTMKELGKAVGIEVGAAAVGVLR